MSVEKAKNVPPFVLWCSATIPTAFDDSMSYYEALCALYKFIQDNMVEPINNNATILEKTVEDMKELKEYVDTYFDNLDVQEEINNKLDAMAEGGQLEEIIAAYIQASSVLAYDTVSDMVAATNYIDGSICKTCGLTSYNDGKGRFYRIREFTQDDVIDGVNIISLTNSQTLVAELLPEDYLTDIEEQEVKIKTNSSNTLNDSTAIPLLMMKKFTNGLSGSGDMYAIQGIAANYKSDHSINKIYVWTVNPNANQSRLFIVTCGSRTDGSDWSYWYTDNVPYTHGSTICYHDGYLYIPNENENVDQQLIKYNLAENNYTYVDLSNLMPICGGIRFDEVSGNFLLNTDNSTMYVVDEQFNLIRTYTHTNDLSINVYQGYDFYNNKEYRTVSTTAGNFIYVFSTITGELLETVSCGHAKAEVESIDIHDGIALLAFNDYNPAINSINSHMICESFIGSWLDGDDVTAALKIRTGFNNRSLAPTRGQYLGEITYFCNNHSNSELIRYVGNGTSTNPYSSALACVSAWYEQSYLYGNSNVQIHLSGTGTCTDDTALRFTYITNNIASIDIRGDSYTLHGSVFVQRMNGSVTLRDIKVDTSNNDRDSGDLTIYLSSIVDFGGSAHTCTTCNVGYCNNVYGSGSVTATGNINVLNNIFTRGYASLFTAGGSLNKQYNVYMS